MKNKAKLLIIALILALFSIGAVAAATENATLGSGDFNSVSYETPVSLSLETDTTNVESSASDSNQASSEISVNQNAINDLKSSSDDSNLNDTIEVKSLNKNSLLGASNSDVLGDTVRPSGTTFQDIRNAIRSANYGDIIDLGGLTYTGTNGDLSSNKNIILQNGILDGGYCWAGLNGITIKNVSFVNFGGASLENSNLYDVSFDHIEGDAYWCTFYVRNSKFSNVNFTNCHNYKDALSHDNFETGVMMVSYYSNFDGCKFINCSSNTHSGAICVAGERGNTANITNSVFDNCTSGVGGAVYLHGTGLTEDHHSNIINCTFTNCEATEWGGALGSSQDYLNVENCDFINNTAKQGAAFMVGGITHGLDGDNSQGHHDTMKNCYFFNNTGTEEGGAVHITGNYNSAIDCIFDDNFAHGGKGAAIYVKGEHASVDNSIFTRHDSDMGTVYVLGNYFNCTDSVFEDNTAGHGGAGIYVEGNHTYIAHSSFKNNNASMHGGAIHTIGDYAKILYSNFTYNNAIPTIESDPEYGLGGAIYIDGNHNEISFSKFRHNTARNGSAIYNRGDEFVLNDDTFENNQAWSYFLFTEAEPPKAYWSEDMEFFVNVTLVAGDNLINAIYNDWHEPTPHGVVDQITFHNVTYTLKPNDLYPTGIKTTTSDEVHPIIGVENSQGGKYLYQDAREDDQLVNINITFDDGTVFEYSGKTNLNGSVAFPITKNNMSDGQFHPGVYTLNAEHPDDYYYTAISNSTTFTVLPHVDVSVTKTSDKDVYIVGENAIFTIRVSGVGTNATDVRVKDILPDALKYVSYTATKGTYDSVNNEWYIGFLPHLGSETLTLTVQTTKLGTYDNVVNVTSAERDWNLSNNVDNKTIHVDVYYTKEANITNVSAGENLEYYLRVFNTGNSDYTEVIQIRDTLPQGIKYLGEYELQGADLVRYINYGDQQIWYITNISAGTRAKITIKAQALEDGIWNNTMNVWDLPEVNATVNVTHNADLQIIKTVSVPKVNKGDIIDWTIVVINHGPSVASDVVVRDILPYGLEQYGVAIPDYPTRFDIGTGTWTIGTLEVERPVKLIIPTRVTIFGRNITNTANVTSTTPDPVPENNEDNETVEFYPDISVVKTVSNRTTSHGAIVTWTIKVTNNGPHDATGVYIIDKLPAGLRYVGSTADVGEYMPGSGRWTIGDLAENQSVTLTINTEVTVYDGFITNNVTVYAPNDGDPTNNFDEDYTEVITKADVGVVKLVSSQTSRYGDEITWTIKVTNYGPNVAENVVLIDYLPIDDLQQTKQPYVSKGQISHEGVTGRWDIGNMTVGETQYMEVYTKVITTDKTIINTVVVTSDTEDPDLSNNRAENGTVVPPEADVEVIKKVSNFTPNKYDNVNWTITVYNAGPNAAENVVVTDVLPNGLRYVSNVAPVKGIYNHNTNKWDLGTLEVGVRYELTITTQVVDTGRITNEVNVTTSTYDTNLTNNYDNETIDVPAIADLEITKIVSNKTPKYGDVITWNITVHNNGPNNARNVVVNDTLPAGLIYMTHKASVGLYDYAQGIWQIGDLGIDKTVTLTITTRVNVTNKTITNVAVVTSDTPDNDTTNNEANNTTDVGPMADLAIDKTVNDHGPNKGDNITWIITVTNKGPDAAINAFAIDILPRGLEFINASGNGTYDKDTNIWTIGDIENGGSRVLYIVTTVVVSKEVITNTVNVTSETPDPDLTNNEDNSTIDVGHETDLEVIKTVSNHTPKKGDKIIWNITVVNHGPDTAVETVVFDVLPEGLVWTSDDSNGAYNPATGEWTIGDLANGTNVTLLVETLVNVSSKNITNVAEVTTDTHDTNESNNKDNDTIDVENIADLKVEKHVNPDVVVSGQTVYWTIYVENLGPDVAVDAYAIDNLPKELIFVKAYTYYGNSNRQGGRQGTGNEYNSTTGVWTIGNMSTGDYGRLTLETIANSTIETTIVNDVFTNSSTPDSDYTNNDAWNSVDVIVVADLEVVKTVSNKNPKFGDEITWTITVTNNGPSDAKDVNVTDKLPAGLIFKDANGTYDKTTGIWTIGDLANGKSVSLVITTIVNITNDTITNVAVVNSTTPDNNTDNNKGNNTTDVDPEADLEIIKLVSNKTAQKGDVITWTIVVTNKGPDSALEVYVRDNFPAGLVLTGYSKTKGIFDENDMTWYMKSLAKGESQTLTLTTLVNISNTTLVNYVNVTNDVYDPNETNNEANNNTTVPPQADLEVVKTAENATYNNGDIIVWTINVTNHGPDASYNVVVTDYIPQGLLAIDDEGNVHDVRIISVTIPYLGVGDSISFNIITYVNVTNDSLTNDVFVYSLVTVDPNPDNNEDNETVTVNPKANLVVEKFVSANVTKTGDVITWTVKVTNNGPDTSVNTRVTDKLPAGLIYNGHKGEGNYDPETGVWIIGDLANGESKVLEISTIVNITNKTIVNVANVTSDTPGNRTNGTNNTTSLGDIADLEVIKLVSNATPKKGDVITWTIIVTNHGPDKAVGVNVTDKLPAGLIYNGHDAEEGLYDPSKGIWIIGNMESGDSYKLFIRTIVDISNGTIENIAVGNSSTPDNNTDNNKGNNTTTVNYDADLEIVKVVSNKNPKYGETITWTITVTNKGPSDAKNVRVTDKLPAGLIFNGANGNYNKDTGVWIVGDLANGKSASLVITTIVNITNTTIRNVANVTSDTPDSNKTNNEANNTTDVDPKADLVVVKVVSNKNPHKGEIITWTVTVTNNGPDKAVNVRVTDKLPAGLIYIGSNGNYNKDTGVWIVGDLANGASASLVITTQVDITNASIRNVANVTSDTPGNGTPGNNTTDVPPEADLEIIKLVSSKTTSKGEVITWTIIVTNNGPDAASNVYVKDTLPAGVTYRAHTTSKGLFDSNSLTWFITGLNNRESATLTIDTLVDVDDTTLVNNVNVTNDVYDPNKTNNKANNTTVVDKELPADLVVIKVVNNANPHKGDIITWTITVTNNGPGAAKDVKVTDKLPAGLIFISSTGDYDKDTGVWTVGDLENRGKATLVITTQVDITNTEITNIAVANSTTDDPNPNNNKDNDTTEVNPEADVKVIKTVSNPQPSEGDVITWTIVVTNLGPDAAKDVIVEENLPDGLQLVSARGSKGSYDDGIWTVGDLDNGEIATLTLTTKVTVSSGTIENIVVATSSTYDPNETNNRDKETTNPKGKTTSADLEITKVANVDKVKVGDKIVWTITVINHGPDKAVGVYVQDILDAGDVEFVSAEPDVGEFDEETGMWDIGDMEVGETAKLIVIFKALSEGDAINYAEVISETPDPNPDNNDDSSTVEIVDGGNNKPPVPDNHNVPTPSKNTTPAMHATGNPIVMVLLALLAIAGVTLRRKD